MLNVIFYFDQNYVKFKINMINIGIQKFRNKSYYKFVDFSFFLQEKKIIGN